jgi:hypothetical protein
VCCLQLGTRLNGRRYRLLDCGRRYDLLRCYFCLNGLRSHYRLWLRSNYRSLDRGFDRRLLDYRCGLRCLGWLGRDDRRLLLDRSLDCRSFDYRLRLGNDLGGTTTANRVCWLGLGSWSLDRRSSSAAATSTGDGSGRGRPGALFTLPPRANSRDLIVG